ncbi:MAG TPA: hypothetical protein VLG74_10300, partial [Blastocatellia bacterium]|nr:hypothetical protein [Blastocatellia bacterium]
TEVFFFPRNQTHVIPSSRHRSHRITELLILGAARPHVNFAGLQPKPIAGPSEDYFLDSLRQL